MSLTLKQKANLFHILFLFPLIYVNLYPQVLGDIPNVYTHHLLLFMIIIGSLYHIYLFMYVNNKQVTFAV